LIFKEQMVPDSEKASLLIQYFWYLLPLTFFTVYYNVLMAYLRSLHLTVMPSFYKEFLVKILITLSISAYALGLVDFQTFVMLYVAVNISATFMIMAYAWRIGQLRFTRFRIPTSLTFRILLVYGVFALLGNSSSMLTGKLDGIILWDLKGEYWVGIYATVFTLISAIEIPTRSMYKIASPQVAEYWSKHDMPRLAHLYKRVSLINTILGTILFIGIWINLDNIFAFVPASYAEGRYVILIVGVGKLFDLVTGLNGIIILTSDKYRWDMLFNLLLVGLVIGLDYALIPEYGIEGAAIGTMIALIAFNVSRLSFVQYFYKMHPFSWRIVLVLLIGGIALLPGLFIPRMPVIVDLPVRSAVVSVIFFGGVYLLKVSDDVNRVGNRMLEWVGFGR
jgi:O-antigen/teichoic acid export membrane protein